MVICVCWLHLMFCRFYLSLSLSFCAHSHSSLDCAAYSVRPDLRSRVLSFWGVCVCVYVDGRVLEPSPMISSTCFARARTRPAIFMCERLTASQPPRWCELRFDNHHGFINILVAYCMRLGPSSIEHGTPEITNAPNDLRLCLALHFGGRTRYEVSDSYACAGINERSGPGIGRQ